jgi:hypothetical protein
LGISTSLLSKWANHDRGTIDWMFLHGHGNRFRLGVKPPQFPEVEDLLYAKFIYRGLYQGLIVRDAWLRREFKRCLEEVKPDGWERAKASKGWCYRSRPVQNQQEQVATGGASTRYPEVPLLVYLRRAVVRTRAMSEVRPVPGSSDVPLRSDPNPLRVRWDAFQEPQGRAMSYRSAWKWT